MDRRAFLAAASAFPMAVSSFSPSSADDRTPDPSQSYEPWLEIRRDHLTFNVDQLSKQAGGRPVLAVLKDNAYGHGIVGTAKHLDGLPAVHGFAVVKVQEALALRESGVRKPVLLLGPASDAELEQVVRQDVMPAVYTDRGAVLARLAAKYQKPVKVHVYLDTGMGRVGVPYYRALPVIEALASHKGIVFDGILTELMEEDELDREQTRRLQEVYDQAKAKGIHMGRRHAASSAGIFHVPEAHLDIVRPGISLYGCYPDDRSEASRTIPLKPAMSFKTRVMYVKQLRTGDSLQYHRAYVASKPVWVATLPVGHTDGWPRETANTCEVLINGRRYPAIASVSANHALIEVGDEPSVATGDEVVLIGESGGQRIEAHDLAKKTKISIYTILMHMNPLLPRRYV